MKVAIVSINTGGKSISNKIKKELDNDPTIIVVDEFNKNVKKILEDIFHDYDIIIGIMAIGIMIRSIYGLMENKTKDPGIIIIDEMGKNVISLLSGHLGGSNNFTIKLSELLDSNPVITTSTDIHGFIGIDELAR